MTRLWFLRRPLIFLASVALLGVLAVEIDGWNAHRRADQLSSCLTRVETAHATVQASLASSLQKQPLPRSLQGMPVDRPIDGSNVIGPWRPRIAGQTVARALGQWLGRSRLNDATVAAGGFPGEWIVRGNDPSSRGFFIEVAVKPIPHTHSVEVVGWIGVPQALATCDR
jgi:hypothetical protein